MARDWRFSGADGWGEGAGLAGMGGLVGLWGWGRHWRFSWALRWGRHWRFSGAAGLGGIGDLVGLWGGGRCIRDLALLLVWEALEI